MSTMETLATRCQRLDRTQADSSPPSPRPPLRVMLWCVPRSVSTAFLRCVAAGCPTEVFHEPFSAAYYFGPERRARPEPGGPPVPEEGQYSYGWVRHQLEADYAGRGAVFCKDMAFAVAGRYDGIPDGYRHTFLIRDPLKAFLSYHKVVQSYPGNPEGVSVRNGLPDGCGYKESYELYRHICAAYRQRPVVVDAEDLLRSPRTVMRKYCAAVGLPFADSMLSWPASEALSPDWHCAPTFRALSSIMGTYQRALRSTSFSSSSSSSSDGASDSIARADLPPGVAECVEFSQPYYKKLYEQRLRP